MNDLSKPMNTIKPNGRMYTYIYFASSTGQLREDRNLEKGITDTQTNLKW